MFSQSSANITAALILILLAVLQAKLDRKTVGQKVVKLTCSPPCRPSGNCYYDWYRDEGRPSHREYVGCSYGASLWLDSTRSSNQDRYTCEVKNNSLPQQNCEEQWGVTYTAEHVCALKGSSVNLSCTYKHPEGLRVTKSLWFIKSHRKTNVEPVDVGESDLYKGRVQYSRTLNYCRMTITDLRESDADTYKFRFYTGDPKGKYTGEPGVTLSVTDLKVTVSDTDGGVKKLTCSSTCTLPNPTYIWYKNRQPVFNQNRNELNLRDRTVDAGSYSCAVKGYEELRSPAVCVFDLQVKVDGPAATASEGQTVTLTCSSTCTLPNPTYIWYKNRQPVSWCESASCSVAVVSEAVSYSCAVKGSDLHSPPVYNRTSVYAASGVAVVLLLIFTAVFLWMRRRAAVTSREREESSGEAPKSGDDTYSALNPNTTSSDYDTLTHVRDSPSDTYSALNPKTMTSDYDTLTPVRDSPSDTYSALNPETRTSDYDTLTVLRPHPVMRRAPENEN
ncbi:uncharacterized protein LOC118803638 isoform X1 [Colossoma macropomum]|uniref:uncharacterized protein LOC118803638 isoform X1 n=1 Tax=Colossoma macropomum TaxID=42526 RepID=UPI0018647914|nr:uncharacterized protein LOC118803638 isoform X1 [Colossoma macropomum]